jgi:hypothetical protein
VNVALTKIELDGAYAGRWAEIDDDPDWGTFEDIVDAMGGDARRYHRLLFGLVKSWNFEDKAGQKLPIPDSDEVIRRIPSRALRQVRDKILEAITSNPKSDSGTAV